MSDSASKETWGGYCERVPLIAGNWKMYKTSREGVEFLRALVELTAGSNNREVIVAPPFIGLEAAVQAVEGSHIRIAAQDMFWSREGAFTGQVAPPMLRDIGVSAVIIGHSERRQIFGETDEMVCKKVRAALDHRLLPIMCAGETGSQREAGQTSGVLFSQVSVVLDEVGAEDCAEIAIAYEPIWAIGTGKTASPDQAQEAIGFIREQVVRIAGETVGSRIRILYGGSVRPDNIDELMAQPDIDGVLVGGASLDVESFARIVQFQRP